MENGLTFIPNGVYFQCLCVSVYACVFLRTLNIRPSLRIFPLEFQIWGSQVGKIARGIACILDGRNHQDFPLNDSSYKNQAILEDCFFTVCYGAHKARIRCLIAALCHKIHVCLAVRMCVCVCDCIYNSTKQSCMYSNGRIHSLSFKCG